MAAIAAKMRSIFVDSNGIEGTRNANSKKAYAYDYSVSTLEVDYGRDVIHFAQLIVTVGCSSHVLQVPRRA